MGYEEDRGAEGASGLKGKQGGDRSPEASWHLSSLSRSGVDAFSRREDEVSENEGCNCQGDLCRGSSVSDQGERTCQAVHREDCARTEGRSCQSRQQRGCCSEKGANEDERRDREVCSSEGRVQVESQTDADEAQGRADQRPKEGPGCRAEAAES